MRVGLLNNLRAGRSGRKVTRILAALRDYPHVFHVETDSVRAVPEALATLAREDIDLLVVNGGDGTLQYTVTQILTDGGFDRIPFVAPLRGGRTNMSALDLGAHRNPVKGLRGLLDDVARGDIDHRIVDRPVLRVETPRDRQVRYGFFFGAGMIHRAIGLTHELFPPGKSQGSLGAGVVTAGLILRASLKRLDGVLTPDKADITLEGEVVPSGEFSLIISSSLQRLFLGIDPFWGDEDGPVQFTCVSSDVELTRAAALGILRGKPSQFVLDTPGYTSRNVDTAEIRLDSGFTVDGEVVAPRADEFVRLRGDRRITFVRA